MKENKLARGETRQGRGRQGGGFAGPKKVKRQGGGEGGGGGGGVWMGLSLGGGRRQNNGTDYGV